MVGSGPHQTSLHHAESANIRQQENFTILSVKRIWMTTRKAACKRSTQVEAVFGGKVVQCMSKVMKKLCNERLMI